MEIKILAILAVLTGSVQATTLITSGDWFTASNWDTGVPDSGSIVSISNNLAATAASSGGAASNVYLNGGLTVNAGGTVDASGGTFVGYVASSSGTGILTLNGGAYSDGGLTIARVNSSKGTVTLTGGTYTSAGTVQIGRGRSVTQAELIMSGGTFNADANDIVLGNDRTCDSLLAVSGGQFTGGTLRPNSAIAESTTTYAIDISGGTFNSTSWGLVGAAIGTLNIKGSSADINVSGNIYFGENITLNAGLDASGFSTIDVGGLVNLRGSTLVVSLLDGATTNDVAGTNVLINAASLSGTFASVDLSAFDGNAAVVYDTASGDVLLTVGCGTPDTGPEPGLIGFSLMTVNSGSWLDYAVWGGVIPSSNDHVQITGGYIVTNQSTAHASCIQIGQTNSAGTLRITGGSILLDGGGDLSVGCAPGSVGKVSQSGGTITVNAGRATYIGEGEDAQALYEMDGGILAGQDVSVGEYGTGSLEIDKTAVVNAAELTIGNRTNSAGFVDMADGQLNTGTITLGREPLSYGELNITDGAVTSTGGWYIGTNGTGKVKVTGTDASITLSGPVVLGENATCSAVMISNGVTTITAGTNQNITLGGTLIVSAPDGEFPSSVVLFETQGSGVISGTFDQVVWQGLTNLKLVYTGTQVRVEKGEEIVFVDSNPKQGVYFGVDAERLWFWKPTWSNESALAFAEISNSYVRVAINCAYEREEGVKTIEAYTNDKIFWVMTSLTNVNPDVKFFASPRPLFNAYSSAEIETIWGGTCPWSPYPAWILQFEPVIGTDGTTNNWTPVYLDEAKLTRYFADYLNLVHSYGFKIEYLDLINENDFITPENGAYVASHLPALLDEGVEMPKLVGPSSWSLTAGAAWINNAPSTFFQVAGVHNSGGDLSQSAMHDFTEAAAARNVDAWNTELHAWIGPGLQSEIVTSAVLWDHFRGGFSSVCPWLFFGNWDETTQSSMVLGGAWYEGVRTNGKYSIYKKLVNETTGGNYLLTYEPLGLKTAAFKRGDTLTVWVLNPETGSETTDVKVPSNISGSVEVSRWHTGLSTNVAVYADVSSLTTGDTNRFAYSFEGESLYCFRINLAANVPDEDSDGIPDSWEQFYFGGATNANPSAFCSNGINTVLQAYIAGLDPNDPQSNFSVSLFSDRILQWNAASGRVCSIYWTTNLMSGFQCLESNIFWPQSRATNSSAAPLGYYKVEIRLAE